ncbi:MAG: Histidine triad (HIT) protein [Candidatus Peregrinibacteria bacterium GW2011_GWA2_47_7]|nr:MAG: Histidine triad (HIT) protein [Candidatus Peregrinibacteria bacterium GW2011_GWA2_47_7]
MEKTLFQKIIDKEIPAEFVFEDEKCIAIKDIYPKAPVHFLVIPRKPIPSVEDLKEEDRDLVAHLIFVGRQLARNYNCEGYRLQFNVGEKGGQVIFHLHLHVMGWPSA